MNRHCSICAAAGAAPISRSSKAGTKIVNVGRPFASSAPRVQHKDVYTVVSSWWLAISRASAESTVPQNNRVKSESKGREGSESQTKPSSRPGSIDDGADFDVAAHTEGRRCEYQYLHDPARDTAVLGIEDASGKH